MSEGSKLCISLIRSQMSGSERWTRTVTSKPSVDSSAFGDGLDSVGSEGALGIEVGSLYEEEREKGKRSYQHRLWSRQASRRRRMADSLPPPPPISTGS
jgi:hypothetical protein